MASSCQIVPFPREGRSSSRAALKGVKCKSMSNRSKTNPTRPRKELLHPRAASVPATGRSQYSHESLGRFKQAASSRLASSMMLIMIGIAKGSDLLKACKIKRADFEELDFPQTADAMKVAPNELGIVSQWRGHYKCIETEKRAKTACIKDGTMWFHVGRKNKMSDTEYEVRYLPRKGNNPALTVITAKDDIGNEWLIAPVEEEVINVTPKFTRTKEAYLIFVKLGMRGIKGETGKTTFRYRFVSTLKPEEIRQKTRRSGSRSAGRRSPSNSPNGSDTNNSVTTSENGSVHQKNDDDEEFGGGSETLGQVVPEKWRLDRESERIVRNSFMENGSNRNVFNWQLRGGLHEEMIGNGAWDNTANSRHDRVYRKTIHNYHAKPDADKEQICYPGMENDPNCQYAVSCTNEENI